MHPTDLPCLIYNYFREAGYLHSAAALACDAMINLADPSLDIVDPSMLRILIGKGMAYNQLESLCLGDEAVQNEAKSEPATQSRSGQDCVFSTYGVVKPAGTADDGSDIAIVRYPLSSYTEPNGMGDVPAFPCRQVLRVLRFGPSVDPALPARLVILTPCGLHLLDEETQYELERRELMLTQELADQAFICPDGLTFALVAKLPNVETLQHGKSSTAATGTGTGTTATTPYHFLVINTVTFYILYRYSLQSHTRTITMGSKWITCICDEQNNATIIPRPISMRSKTHLNLSVPGIPSLISNQILDRATAKSECAHIELNNAGWSACAFQTEGTCSGLSSYFYSTRNEVLALYSRLGILMLYVPFTDDEEAPTTPRYIDIYSLLNLKSQSLVTEDTPSSTMPNSNLALLKMRFVDSTPYIACLTNYGLAVINYVTLLYDNNADAKQYSSWVHSSEEFDSVVPVLEVGTWDGHKAIVICQCTRIIVFALESGVPLFSLTIKELQDLYDDQIHWGTVACQGGIKAEGKEQYKREQKGVFNVSFSGVSVVKSNTLVVLVAEGTGNNNKNVWCIKLTVDRVHAHASAQSQSSLLESSVICQYVGVATSFIGIYYPSNNSKETKRLYLSSHNGDVIEIALPRSPHR